MAGFDIYVVGLQQTGGCWLSNGRGYYDRANAVKEQQTYDANKIFTLEVRDYDPREVMIWGMVAATSPKNCLPSKEDIMLLGSKLFEEYERWLKLPEATRVSLVDHWTDEIFKDGPKNYDLLWQVKRFLDNWN